MLIEFTFSNYRSFRESTTLSMEATGLGALKSSLIHWKTRRVFPRPASPGRSLTG